MKCTCGAFKVYGAEPGSKLHSDWCDGRVNYVVATKMLIAALKAGNYNVAPSTLSQGSGPPPVTVPNPLVELSTAIKGIALPEDNLFLCIACTAGGPGVMLVNNIFGQLCVYCGDCASQSTKLIDPTKDLSHTPKYSYTHPIAPLQLFTGSIHSVRGRASCSGCRSYGRPTIATEFLYGPNGEPVSGWCSTCCAKYLSPTPIAVRMTHASGIPKDTAGSSRYYYP